MNVSLTQTSLGVFPLALPPAGFGSHQEMPASPGELWYLSSLAPSGSESPPGAIPKPSRVSDTEPEGWRAGSGSSRCCLWEGSPSRAACDLLTEMY